MKIFKTGIAMLSLALLFSCQPDNDGYSAYDADDDDYWDEDEFSTALTENDWYGDWDENEDGMINRAEWDEGFADIDAQDEVFEEWDENNDGLVSGEEFHYAVFQMWDSDGDGFIDPTEYQDWNK